MKRFLLSVALWCGALAYPAFAGTGTITVKDGGGVTRTFDVVTDGSGNFIGMQVLCDGSAAAQCAAVKAASSGAAAATDPALVVTVRDVNANVSTNADAVASAATCCAPVVNYNFGYNGTTWDRLQVDGSKNLKTAVQAIATGGSSTTGNIAANNTTAVVVKASAGTLYGAQLYGVGSAPAYLKIYNAASATCGSGTPVKRLMIPAASTAANGSGSNVVSFPGINFGTGITYCVTTGITDADATAPAASTFLVNLDWQ